MEAGVDVRFTQSHCLEMEQPQSQTDGNRGAKADINVHLYLTDLIEAAGVTMNMGKVGALLNNQSIKVWWIELFNLDTSQIR